MNLAGWATNCARRSRRDGNWPGWNCKPICAAKRLAVVWLASAVMALTALPLVAVGAAEMLNGCGGLHRGDWLLIFAGGLLILALAGGYFAWRRFRRQFIGLRETIEELREDVVWLREARETKPNQEEA